MKISTVVFGAAALMSLAACVSPETAAQNRAAHMAKLFPNPADRHGLHLVFPVSGHTLITSYFPNQITEPEVMRRLSELCRRMGEGTHAVRDPKPTTTDTKNLGHGQMEQANEFVAKCEG